MSDELSSIDLSGLVDDDDDDAVEMDIEEEEEEEEIGFMDVEILDQVSPPTSPFHTPSSFSKLFDDVEEGEKEDEKSSSSGKRKVSDLEDDEEELDEEGEGLWVQKAVGVLEGYDREVVESPIGKEKEKEEDIQDDDLDDLFDNSSEIREKKKRLAVLKKLDQAAEGTKKSPKPKINKKKPVSSSTKTEPKKKRQKTTTTSRGKSRSSSRTTKSDPTIFPNAKDMVGLMAYIQSSGYDIICKGSQESELSEKNREEVSDEVYALANLFGKRLNGIKDAFIDNFKKAIIDQGKTKGQDSTKLVALITAIQKYRRMIAPLGEDLKPKSKSPWTNADIVGEEAHSGCTRIVIIPDEEEAKPLVFYESDEITGLYKAIHTLCHFGAYLRIDLDRIINKAKKAVDDAEDPDVIWESVFDPRGDIPEKKKDQKEGTRLISLKQTLLGEMCRVLRTFSIQMGAPEDPFKMQLKK